MILPPVVGAVMWQWLLHPLLGVVNLALGGIGVGPQNWLGDATEGEITRAIVLPLLAPTILLMTFRTVTLGAQWAFAAVHVLTQGRPAGDGPVSAVPRVGAGLGFAMRAAGLLVFLTVTPESSLLLTVLPAFFVTGAGAPIACIPVTGAAVEDVGEDAGLASGLFNTVQQVANTLALAVMAVASLFLRPEAQPRGPEGPPRSGRRSAGLTLAPPDPVR